jgi:spermidine synthase/Flp pilus assembly protein TadD
VRPREHGLLNSPVSGLLYFLFFCSGLSGLIYQVTWVRVFGNVFGNTVYSASLVVAVFMLGLGVGSYVAGVWADRRYVTQPESLLRAYGFAEVAIALLGAGVAALLPHLGQISAVVSSYSRDASGWYVLSTSSHLLVGAVAIVLLTPMTLVMGGTLTLLIRHLARKDFEIGARRTALIYGVNTVGAALGCFLTDFWLVPAAGLRAAQLVAVVMNLVAAAGAFLLTWRARTVHAATVSRRTSVASVAMGSEPLPHSARSVLALTSVALALTGFAAMGMEILWLRHFSLLLGEFRAVFSLLLTVVLLSIGAGALVGGFLPRRTAPEWLMVAQGLFVASALLGLARANVEAIHAAARGLETMLSVKSAWERSFAELWFNAKPILSEVAGPALLMGLAFPLGNAVVQLAERSVGRRAGVLYLSNTIGSVCGSLAAGFGLLPLLGIQGSAAILSVAGGLAILPLYMVSRARSAADSVSPRLALAPVLASTLTGGVALALWLQLPSDYVVRRAQVLPTGGGRLLALSEGVTEVIAVTETPHEGRALVTNGHPMAGTDPLGQRYMRALAHIPLLSLDNPASVLVIGFGVGNTTHAATLHPSVRRVEVADLSRHVLLHANYFKDANADVLNDRRVSVYVNDGRQHLQMQPEASYDLIALEPPPIAYAGVGALYSREFYALARTRLTQGGYVSQWLPAYQVPAAVTLAMVRAFVEIFPQAVLLSGAKADLLLLGANDAPVEIDPARLAARLSNAPAAQADLQQFALGSVREIVGMFVGSARNLAEASRDSAPVTDDRPILEYSVRSLLNTGRNVVPSSASLLDLSQIPTWCPRCFVDGKPVPLVDGIDTYLTLLDQFYTAAAVEAVPRPYGTRIIDGSAYLGAILPESADVHEILGIAMMNRGQVDRATAEFREALRVDPDSATAHWRLGNALASRAKDEAVDHLRRSVALRPDNSSARHDLAAALLEGGHYDEALDHFRAALPSMPNAAVEYNTLGVGLVSRGKLADAIDQFREAIRLRPTYVEAYNNLGTALAFQGKREEAVEQFQQALTLQPGYAEARRNLVIVRGGVVPPALAISGGVTTPQRPPSAGR